MKIALKQPPNLFYVIGFLNYLKASTVKFKTLRPQYQDEGVWGDIILVIQSIVICCNVLKIYICLKHKPISESQRKLYNLIGLSVKSSYLKSSPLRIGAKIETKKMLNIQNFCHQNKLACLLYIEEMTGPKLFILYNNNHP